MQIAYDIQYLANAEIDKVKWDACIDGAGTDLVYASSGYLDRMAKQWDGLVLMSGEKDYAAVMPLVWNRKFGIDYLYQPFLTAQLGLIARDNNPVLLHAFLSAIPARFKYWDFYLNYANPIASTIYPLYRRKNFVLDLGSSYEMIYGQYSENIQRNIKKAEKAGFVSVKDFPPEKVVALAAGQVPAFGKISQDDWQRFLQLYQDLYHRGQAMSYGIAAANGGLMSSCILFSKGRRVFYILAGNHPDGRTSGSSHALINSFIKEKAGHDLVLDFEGSDIESLAHFYSSFGAKEEDYAGVKLNRLPFLLKWLKG